MTKAEFVEKVMTGIKKERERKSMRAVSEYYKYKYGVIGKYQDRINKKKRV